MLDFQVFHLDLQNKAPLFLKKGVLALGNFDGVHKGHQEILNITKQHALNAAKINLKHKKPPALALSFEPHPRQYFNQNLKDFRLTPLALKAKAIQHMGFEGLIILAFDQKLANLSAAQFIEKIIIEQLAVQKIIIGHDFHFGKGREGTAHFLKSYHQFETIMVEAIKDEHATIYASSKIREHLDHGEIKAANQLLGRPYILMGAVVKGKQLGRTIGFPTANIDINNQKMPKFGVYAVRLYQENSRAAHDGIANYGIKPTIAGENAPCFEVYCFDFNHDLYGQIVQIELLDYIRAEQKFANLEALKAQIAYDCDQARTILG